MVGDIAKDIERVYGKERLLVEIASASINEPSGRICDVIFPIAGKAKLAAIVKESHAKGALDRRIYKVMCQRRSKSRPFGGVKPGHRVTCRGEWREGVARGPLPPALV